MKNEQKKYCITFGYGNGSLDSDLIISGKSITKLVIEALKNIRPKSRDFYKVEIAKSLKEYGIALVDKHAANGRYMKIILK